MPLTRSAPWTLLLAAGFALIAAPDPSLARQDKKDDLPKRPANFSDVLTLKTTPIPPEKLPAAKAAFKAFAQYFGEYVSHPRVYSAPQEFVPEASGSARPETLEKLRTQLAEHIWVPQPNPLVGTRPNADNAAYTNELAAELDATFFKIIKENPIPIVKINAARMLAVAAKSGAPVHYATVTELLTNPNYPPEVKYYAYQAAEGLLGAYDFADYRGRKHTLAVIDKVGFGKLVKAVNDAVFAPAQLLAGGAKGDPATAPTPGQLEVHGYIRRGAVRALAQVRFASVEDDTGTIIYPAHTLARVAISDPALVPPPSASEIAEAVIGVCNMTPTKGYNADTAAEVVAVGLRSFAGTRAGNPLDRSIAWKVYSARLAEGLRVWRGLFDPAFDPARPNAFVAALVPKSVEAVAKAGLDKILGPIDKSDVTVRVDLAAMSAAIEDLRKLPGRKTALFPDTAKTTLDTLPK